MGRADDEARKLNRSAGLPVVVEYALDIPWIINTIDPNGYYKVLGYEADRVWMMADVRKAFRSKSKLYHPDGQAPNSREFDRVRIAYSVLGNPQFRAEYDRLDSTRIWLDEELIEKIVKILKRKKIKSAKMHAWVPPGVGNFVDYVYYYDGDSPPPSEIRGEWVHTMMQTAWELGIRGEIKIGFTQGEPYVSKKPWRTIYMVSGEVSGDRARDILLGKSISN